MQGGPPARTRSLFYLIESSNASGVRKAFAELGGSIIGGGSAGGNGNLGFNVPPGDRAALRVASYYTHIGGRDEHRIGAARVDDDAVDVLRGG